MFEAGDGGAGARLASREECRSAIGEGEVSVSFGFRAGSIRFDGPAGLGVVWGRCVPAGVSLERFGAGAALGPHTSSF